MIWAVDEILSRIFTESLARLLKKQISFFSNGSFYCFYLILPKKKNRYCCTKKDLALHTILFLKFGPQPEMVGGLPQRTLKNTRHIFCMNSLEILEKKPMKNFLLMSLEFFYVTWILKRFTCRDPYAGYVALLIVFSDFVSFFLCDLIVVVPFRIAA